MQQQVQTMVDAPAALSAGVANMARVLVKEILNLHEALGFYELEFFDRCAPAAKSASKLWPEPDPCQLQFEFSED